MESMITIENLSYHYPSEDTVEPPAAVNQICLTVERGAFTAVIGHNGSGKSTLAKLMCAILTPTEGTVLIHSKTAGRSYDTKNDGDIMDIRKTVGMVFQNPDNQLVATIVEEDVAFAPENLGLAPAEIRTRVDEALSIVGLTDYARHDTHKLSGGQKQRVAIAGILAMKPECIIFDESTAMLDPKGRSDILQTILKLKQQGITVLLITHYMNEAALADHVVVVDNGRVLTEGSPNEVFCEQMTLKQAGLSAPQPTLLANALREGGMPLPQTILDAKQAVAAIEQAMGGNQA